MNGRCILLSQLKNKYFTRKKIGVDISNNNVKAIESTLGIYVDKPIEEIIGTESTINQINYWQDARNIAKIMNFCISKLGKILFKPDVLLSIPAELSYNDKEMIINNIVNNVQSISFLQNIIAAAIVER